MKHWILQCNAVIPATCVKRTNSKIKHQEYVFLLMFGNVVDQIGVEAGKAVHVGDDQEADKVGASAVGIDCWWVYSIYLHVDVIMPPVFWLKVQSQVIIETCILGSLIFSKWVDLHSLLSCYVSNQWRQ